MMLQYSMLLLGSFESKPVHNSDIIEAQKILNMYAVELSERDIPCRFVSHQITHMPQDVAKYKCGIEKLSAFRYESFLIFFRRSLRSGNLPTEQLRNRLVEKKKYQLPTTASGVIIDNKVQLLLEAKRKSNACAPIQYHHKGGNLPKKMVFF